MSYTNSRHNLPQPYSRKAVEPWSARRVGIILASGLFFASASAAFAEEYSWKEGFAGCTGTSPFIETLISKTDPDVRPLMKIGDMQAWAIKDADGTPATALTTQDGLTIIGKIVGPQGEDISAALLATMPDPSATATVTPPRTFPQPGPPVVAPASQHSTTSPTQPSATMTPIPNTSPRQAIPSQTTSPALNRLQQVLQPAAAAAPPATSTAPDASEANVATAPITAIEQPSANVQAGIDAIFEQAGDERIWFSAGTAKEGAPVVYMLADPECPHCQWTIDQMHSQIAGGEIDLRIIFAPITGVGGFNTSLSILHSQNIPETFMAHMTSKTRGTTAVTQMDTNQADKAVVQGIVDNINWMRANKMPGVPFFLYQTDQGAKFAFSELPTDILTVAKAQ